MFPGLCDVMFSCQDDQAMITLTGFDIESIQYQLHLFTPVHEHYTPFMDADGFLIWKVSLTRGRPRLMNPTDCLGLVLAWSRTKGSLMVLQLIFGIMMSLVAKCIQFACGILVKILKSNNFAKIKLPSPLLENWKSIGH